MILFAVTTTIMKINCVKINCDSISDYRHGRKYCIIKNVTIGEYSKVTYEQSFFSTHKTELIFDKCEMFSIPKGIFKAFPNVRTMYTWNSGIQSIEKSDFKNASNLRVLDLSHNLITFIDDSTFFWAIDLEFIDLSKNRLKRMGQQAFHGLVELKILYLHNNQLDIVQSGTFSVLPKLETLHLNDNFIQIIDGRFFEKNFELSNLYLNNNNITTLSFTAFMHLGKLINFDLHNNPIRGSGHIHVNAVHTNLRNTSVQGIYIGVNTKKLLASNNRISYAVVENNTKNVFELNLADNHLTSFENFTKLNRLKELDLSNNKIMDFQIYSFANMTDIEILKLRSSGLKNVTFGLFSHLSKLTILDVSFNQLGDIHLNKFTALKNLKYLYLEGNNITKIDMTDVRKYFPSLMKIGISRNLWICKHLADAVYVLESNKIELNSIGLTKNHTNIKGIPCTSELTINSNLVNNTENLLSKQISDKYLNNSNVEKNGKINQLNKNCSVLLTNSKEMELIIKLIELKYEIQDASETIAEISTKLDYVLQTINDN